MTGSAGRTAGVEAATAAGGTVRAERARATQELILVTAERLFAERGLFAVSNRQISEAAGQGNNTAVGYHFGAKTDLVRAIERRHAKRIEQLRGLMVAEVAGSADLRDWVGCLVLPMTSHLASLDSPTWFARFAVQVMADPMLRELVAEEALTAPSLRQVLGGLHRCLPNLPPEVRKERFVMTRQLIVHTCAERERALADGTATARASWHEAGTGLVDAIVGLWRAPVTTPRRRTRRPRQ